jgi:hypothetical protein
MQKMVVECDKCGKQVIVKDHIESTGMVKVNGLNILAMVDIPVGKSSRPCLSLKDQDYCPDCFLKVIKAFVTGIPK